MPQELLLIRRGTALFPAYQTDRDEMERLPRGSTLTASISKTASPKLKGWYRALLAKLVEALGHWPTEYQAHRQLLIRCGYFEAIDFDGSGVVRVTPASTREWDHFAWRNYVDILVQVLVEEHFGNIRDRDLLREIEQFVGISYEEIER